MPMYFRSTTLMALVETGAPRATISINNNNNNTPFQLKSTQSFLPFSFSQSTPNASATLPLTQSQVIYLIITLKSHQGSSKFIHKRGYIKYLCHFFFLSHTPLTGDRSSGYDENVTVLEKTGKMI